jgi:hypothetical protein
MSEMKKERSRREFIALSSVAALTCELLAEQSGQQELSPGPVPADPTPEELEVIHQSKIAQDLIRYFGNHYSCAESGLAVCLRHLDQPEELVWFAGGFGGGLGQRDLCGFLTSGIMAIGLYSGSLGLERTEAKKVCHDLVQKYWQWWQANAPLHCSQIREGHTDERVCVRVGYLAMAKIEELLNKG